VSSPVRPASTASAFAARPSRPAPGSAVAPVAHARSLLDGLGWDGSQPTSSLTIDPDLDWARSGAMALTGPADGPPRLARAAPTAAARGALLALEAVASDWDATRCAALADLDGPALLGERAALAGLTRRGDVAPGGRARLLRARDGWLALNLARPDDEGLLPAWLEGPVGDTPWTAAGHALPRRSVAHWVSRARLMALPAAPVAPPPVRPPAFCRASIQGAARVPDLRARPVVLDFSSLWAGPLGTSLLAALGARVVKVESTARPDGARRGSPEFFDLLNAGKQSVAVDFGSAADRRALARLLERADVVVESARPRALAQLGFDAHRWIAGRPGRTWLSITGYGRALPWGGWVAFGDDAAAAAGWCLDARGHSAPLFCGDALADPLTGLHAAVAALVSWRAGGGRLLDVSLRDVAAHALAITRRQPAAGAAVERRGNDWWVTSPVGRTRVAPPRARAGSARAPALGAHTEALLRRPGSLC
jgi:crotonobetainyl-CoA:carnitine CoA-transferase CaiB-like acyl-CoA transferase